MDLYGSWTVGYKSYTSVAKRLATESLRDDFLLTHYTGETLPEPETPPTATPSPTATASNPTATPSIDIVAPGGGNIEITALEPLSDYATLDEPLLIDTTIEGDNVAFVYFYAGYSNPISVVEAGRGKPLWSPGFWASGRVFYNHLPTIFNGGKAKR